MEFNVLICGIGGQGAVYLGTFLRNYFLYQYPDAVVLGTESRGVSQREGSVTATIRIQTNSNPQLIFSPEIPPLSADLIIALEPLELLRNFEFIHNNSLIIVNNEPVIPKSSVKWMFSNTNKEEAFHVNSHSKPKWLVEKIESLIRTIPIKSKRNINTISSINLKSGSKIDILSYSKTPNVLDVNFPTLVLDEMQTSSNLNLAMIGFCSRFMPSLLKFSELIQYMEKEFSSNASVLQKNKRALQFGYELAKEFVKTE